MRVYIYGAGGHGKVVAEIVIAAGEGELAGFIDDAAALHGTTVLGRPVFGGGEWLRSRARGEELAVIPAIGANHSRLRVQQRLVDAGLTVRRAIHPTAAVSPSARIDAGAVVMALAAINADARIGEGAIINTGAVIEHDVSVGRFAHVSPRSVVGGEASVEELAHVGIGATVLPRVKVGRGAVLGAGAVAVRDVPAGTVAIGVPARVRRPVT